MGAENRVQIDSSHCRAICEEIGERLRIMLDRDATPLPDRLQVLMLRLAAQELAASRQYTADGTVEDMTEPVLAA